MEKSLKNDSLMEMSNLSNPMSEMQKSSKSK